MTEICVSIERHLDRVTEQSTVCGSVFTTNNKILNTIGAAVGSKNAAGGPLDNFGDPTLAKGMIDAIVSGA